MNKPRAVDYILHIQTSGTHSQTTAHVDNVAQDPEESAQIQKWVVCNQMGGSRATALAQSNTHDL
eukprot:4783213-Ditylum_brightwellii.AAC.1